MNILETIATHRREQVEVLKIARPLDTFIDRLPKRAERPFRKALTSGDDVHIIAEIKRGSPSRGIFTNDFNPANIAENYRDGGATAISVLTEERYFMGKFEYLPVVSNVSGLPVLCKDFVIDQYQLYFARLMQADAILLIVRLLQPDQITLLLGIADEVGLDCLVEVHDEKELEIALTCDARIIGVNSRNLDDFTVSLATAERLATRIPDGIVKVAESGISSYADITRLQDSGYDAFLIGESLMTASDPVTRLKELRGL